MYESPIKLIVSEMQAKMEESLLCTVSQTLGYDISKDELIKAIEFDRNQYEKGYTDGLKASKWIDAYEKIPDEDRSCLVWYKCDTVFGKSQSIGISFCSRCAWYTNDLNGDNIEILYWQYLPEPPKECETL